MEGVEEHPDRVYRVVLQAQREQSWQEQCGNPKRKLHIDGDESTSAAGCPGAARGASVRPGDTPGFTLRASWLNAAASHSHLSSRGGSAAA
ncbi:hypothetical protein NQZ68_004188 [Dissostichus eleginoides]|nr:hypothetical protein NQZ68_004188 [Dissostichus eleginoides]